MADFQIEKPSILVVDDTPENIDVLKATLKDAYIVRPALKGEVALRIAAAEPQPDLILLDIMMPGMDGYEVMRRLKENESTRDIPVIFVTALADLEGELKGLELGAVDYIPKPINPQIVRARVQTHLALRDARRKLEKQNGMLLQEREIVEDIITRMRSSRYFDDRHLRYLVSSVDRTNGDILMASHAPDGRQWIMVGDFTGHGLPAAVAAPLITYVFYTQTNACNPMEEILAEISTVMCQQLPINIFMTACMVEISASRDRLKVWNAGMPPCVLMRGGTVVGRMASRAIPLGIPADMDFVSTQEIWDVQEGDRLYVFSDGVTEVASPGGELFEMAGVERFLQTLHLEDKGLPDLLQVLEAFHGDDAFHDDITMVEIRI